MNTKSVQPRAQRRDISSQFNHFREDSFPLSEPLSMKTSSWGSASVGHLPPQETDHASDTTTSLTLPLVVVVVLRPSGQWPEASGQSGHKL